MSPGFDELETQLVQQVEALYSELKDLPAPLFEKVSHAHLRGLRPSIVQRTHFKLEMMRRCLVQEAQQRDLRELWKDTGLSLVSDGCLDKEFLTILKAADMEDELSEAPVAFWEYLTRAHAPLLKSISDSLITH